MPRFHFDVHAGVERRGRESLDLPDLDAARDKARSLAAVHADRGNIAACDAVVVTVRDATLSILTIVRMACRETSGRPT